jgi:ribosomal protein S27AE
MNPEFTCPICDHIWTITDSDLIELTLDPPVKAVRNTCPNCSAHVVINWYTNSLCYIEE